jgi:hypothetical protein
MNKKQNPAWTRHEPYRDGNCCDSPIIIQIAMDCISIPYKSLVNASICLTQPQCHIQLTIKGFQKLPHLGKHNDFDFPVSHIHCRCPWYVACFISPRIGQQLGTDASLFRISHFNQRSEQSVQNNSFACIWRQFVCHFRRSEFWWINFHWVMYSEIMIPSLDNSKVMSLFQMLLTQLFHCQKLVCVVNMSLLFVASHFHNIPSTFYERISTSILEPILSHSDLNIAIKDSLYQFVRMPMIASSWVDEIRICVNR